MGYLFLQITRLFEILISTIGIHLSVSAAGIPFFGFPVTYLTGSYALAILLKAGVPAGFAVTGAIIASILMGLFFVLLYRRLSADSFNVFTVASILAFDALLRSWSSVTGGVLGIGLSRPPLISTLPKLMVLCLIIGLAILLLEYLLLNSPFGHRLQALKESHRLLDAGGISSKKAGSIVILITSVLTALSGILGAWRIQFLDPSFGGIQLFIFGLTVAILAFKPKISWIFAATFVVLFIPELLRFLPLPANIFGYLRILINSIFLMVLVHRLSAKYTDEKRII